MVALKEKKNIFHIIKSIFTKKKYAKDVLMEDNFINPLFHNVEKWPNKLLKSCGVNTARCLKYVWPFFNIMK